MLLRLAALVMASTIGGLAIPVTAAELTVVGFNVESDNDTDPNVVAPLIRDLQGVDIWGLSEVADDDAAVIFLNAAKSGENGSFRYFLSRSGRSDRLAIIYNRSELELLETRELHYLQFERDGQRATLIGRFKQRATGKALIFMVNHLARGDEPLRHEQAQLLNQFAKDTGEAIIAVGDYNFDWEVVGGDADHDQGFDNMTADGAFEWVRPPTLIKTQCDPAFNSVLDFVFAAGDAKMWSGTSEILEQQEGYCDGEVQGGSDHRPVRATFDIQ